MKLLFGLVLTLALVASLTSLVRAQPIIDGKAHLAFINDGMLVVMNDAGKLTTTDIRCSQASICQSGYVIAYTGEKILTEFRIVAKGKNTHFGETWQEIGIGMLDLRTGANTLLTKEGDFATISPDEKTLAYIDGNGEVSTLEITTGNIHKYYSGDSPVWLDNNTFLFAGLGMVYKANIGAKPTRLPKFDAKTALDFTDSSGATKYLAGGGKLCVLGDLKACGKGLASFSIYRNSIANYKVVNDYSLAIVDTNGLVEGINLGPDPNSLPVVDPINHLAAFTDRFDAKIKPNQLYIARFKPVPNGFKPKICGEGSIITHWGSLTNIVDLSYYGGKLYCCTIANADRIFDIEGGLAYYIADRQFDPIQLKLMGLDPKIAEKDTIWLIDPTGKKTKISSGHGLTVRN